MKHVSIEQGVAQSAILKLQDVCKNYGSTVVVDRISIELQRGELLTLLGPSGCGKTTTLRMIGGFLDATSGQIFLSGKDITRVAPARRDTAMVFQSYALFPHLSAAENIAFGLRRRKVDKVIIAEKVGKYLELLGLDGLGDRLPRELSGGQQQRVAVARALAVEPAILLMDEPFSNLDAGLRQSTATELRRLQQQIGTTVVLVTHDKEEALAISDRVAVLSNGVLEQVSSAEDIYEKPATRFVADFASKANILEGSVASRDGAFVIVDVPGIGKLKVRHDGDGQISGAVAVAVRPEVISLNADPSGQNGNHARGTVKSTTYLGNSVRVAIEIAGGHEVHCLLLGARAGVLAAGEDVSFSWAIDDGVLLLK